jgi:hypothetical protein
MDRFARVTPTWIPVVYADERAAWEGPLPERPDLRVRVEAAAYAGRPVFVGVTGSWTRSARAPAAAPSRFTAIVAGLASLIKLGLILLGALLARRNLRLERGDRRGALRAATAVFLLGIAVWVLNEAHMSTVAIEIQRGFAAIGGALFDAAVLWVAYLGLEPYVRRTSPDTLIGWTRLVSGQWRDARVGRDALIGISAGLLMTLFYATHNLLPALAGGRSPMPLASNTTQLVALRYTLSWILYETKEALTSAMIGTAGVAALVAVLRRPWLALPLAAIVFTPVVVSGMFMPGTPLLDVFVAGCIVTVFVGTIARFGLLASVLALFMHFTLLHAPITANLSAWWATASLCILATIVALTLTAANLARTGAVPAR